MAKIQSKEERDRLFGEAPIWKALATMAIPTVVAQLINLIYNMADAFFVGRTGNPYMIAAISLSFSLFLFTIPISGMFGIGGGSYIARLLGVKEYDRVKHVSAFSFYGAMAVAILYSLGVFLFMNPLLRTIGASDNTIGFARQYIMMVVVLGNTPVVLSATLSHMLRNVGYSREASFGLSAGGVLNMILDPLFMFVIMPDGYQVLGAATATFLANLCAMLYFITIFMKTRKETGLSIHISDVHIDSRDASEIFKVGIPTAATSLLMDFANMYLNASMAAHGDLSLAALGIEAKIERLSNAICLGIAQGTLPLVAFNYSAGNTKRTRSFINASRIAGGCAALISILFYQLLAGVLIRTFISSKGNPEEIAMTVSLGILFLRIRSLAAPFSMLNFTAVNGFQAMGDGKLALAQTFVRQILLFFPLMILFDKLFGAVGLVAALPTTEFLSAMVSTWMIQRKLRKVELEKGIR